MMLKRARNRARVLGLPYNLELEDVRIPKFCPVLGIPVEVVQGEGKHPHDRSPSIDRINPKLGYVKGNVAIISHRANRIKNDATPAELRAVATWVEAVWPPAQ